ncbi:MAG: DegT/DnrJ/EryC1/StrS family aminotransferase [Cyclobacteriaceae bacterium]
MLKNSEEEVLKTKLQTIDEKILLSPLSLSGAEQELLHEALAIGQVASSGTHIVRFEQRIADICGTKYAIGLNSGTAAIHLALKLLNIKAGDTVLCQSMTYCATAYPIQYVGARPVFIDSEFDTWNMDPALLEKAIKQSLAKGIKPAAIIYVHIYGMPAKYDEISALATQYEIPLIEDAAEALGSSYKGRPAGSLGDMGIISFNGNKIITTGGGGMLCSNSPNWYNHAAKLANQGKDQMNYFAFDETAHNYRITNLAAAFGLGQLTDFDSRIVARQHCFIWYNKYLKNITGVDFQKDLPGHISNRWLSVVLFPDNITRNSVKQKLLNAGIEATEAMKPLHTMPLFAECEKYINGVSADLHQRGLCLPSGSHISEKEVKQITEIFEVSM